MIKKSEPGSGFFINRAVQGSLCSFVINRTGCDYILEERYRGRDENDGMADPVDRMVDGRAAHSHGAQPVGAH